MLDKLVIKKHGGEMRNDGKDAHFEGPDAHKSARKAYETHVGRRMWNHEKSNFSKTQSKFEHTDKEGNEWHLHLGRSLLKDKKIAVISTHPATKENLNLLEKLSYIPSANTKTAKDGRQVPASHITFHAGEEDDEEQDPDERDELDNTRNQVEKRMQERKNKRKLINKKVEKDRRDEDKERRTNETISLKSYMYHENKLNEFESGIENLVETYNEIVLNENLDNVVIYEDGQIFTDEPSGILTILGVDEITEDVEGIYEFNDISIEVVKIEETLDLDVIKKHRGKINSSSNDHQAKFTGSDAVKRGVNALEKHVGFYPRDIDHNKNGVTTIDGNNGDSYRFRVGSVTGGKKPEAILTKHTNESEILDETLHPITVRNHGGTLNDKKTQETFIGGNADKNARSLFKKVTGKKVSDDDLDSNGSFSHTNTLGIKHSITTPNKFTRSKKAFVTKHSNVDLDSFSRRKQARENDDYEEFDDFLEEYNFISKDVDHANLKKRLENYDSKKPLYAVHRERTTEDGNKMKTISGVHYEKGSADNHKKNMEDYHKSIGKKGISYKVKELDSATAKDLSNDSKKLKRVHGRAYLQRSLNETIESYVINIYENDNVEGFLNRNLMQHSRNSKKAMRKAFMKSGNTGFMDIAKSHDKDIDTIIKATPERKKQARKKHMNENELENIDEEINFDQYGTKDFNGKNHEKRAFNALAKHLNKFSISHADGELSDRNKEGRTVSHHYHGNYRYTVQTHNNRDETHIGRTHKDNDYGNKEKWNNLKTEESLEIEDIVREDMKKFSDVNKDPGVEKHEDHDGTGGFDGLSDKDLKIAKKDNMYRHGHDHDKKQEEFEKRRKFIEQTAKKIQNGTLTRKKEKGEN